MKKSVIVIMIAFVLQLLVACTVNASYEDNTGTVNLTDMIVTGSGIRATDNRVEITEGGDFTVTGENSNAMIYVNTTDKVKLRLSGMSLKNESGPAIFFENAEKALITITKDTQNYIEDGSDYGEIDAKAALFSNDDLEIKGNGTLTVTGNYKHAIASDDDILIENGTVNITSNGSDGIHTNNTFSMMGGTLNITAVSDGIQAEEDVVIDGGIINVLKSEEGIESGTTLTVNGGEINITSSDDGLNSGGGTDNGGEMFPGVGGGKPSGDFSGGTERGGQRMQRPADMPENIPADRPDMPQRAQGAERDMNIPPNTAANKGNTDTQNTQTVDCSTYINGGIIRINASGDGIDSNDSVYINGGEIYVDGPESGADSAIDGNRLVISGGKLLAIGSSGMAMGASQESEQCSFTVNLTESVEVGSVVTIKDSSGNVLAERNASKRFNSILYSDAQLKESEIYTIYVDGEIKQSVEMSTKQVFVGERSGMNRGEQGGNRPYGGQSEGGMQNGSGPSGGKPSANGCGAQNIKVMLYGKELTFDTTPIIKNETTLVPLRTIFEALGMTVEWDEETERITAKKDGLTITLTVGSTAAKKNNEEITLLTAPVVTGEGRTLVPIRFISESCGLSVTWDGASNTVTIE